MIGHFLGRAWEKYISWVMILYYFGCLIGYFIVSKPA